MNILETLGRLVRESGFAGFFAAGGWKYLVMIVIACVLLYLGIGKKFEPLLLVGIAFGALLTNIPGAGLYHMAMWDAYVQGCPYDAANDYALYSTENGQKTVLDIAYYEEHYAEITGLGGEAEAPEVIEHLSFTDIIHHGGLLDILYIGVKAGIYPCLIFMGVGAMTDFGPLIANPKSLLLGAAAQLGIFMTYVGTQWMGFTPRESSSIGIIGGADGPTAIFVTSRLAPHLLGPIAVAAYSYMALVPVIQPPIMKALTTHEERKIKMRPLRQVSQKEKIVFPIMITVFVALLVPSAAPLVACLMLGNLAKESGVADRLSKAMSNELMNIVTIFLGFTVGATATSNTFLSLQTIKIMVMGVVAFGFGTAGGVLLAKLMNLFLKEKINPLIGSAGVSAVPMAARVSQVVGQKENPSNFLLMHAMGPNVAGVIGSAIAAGTLMALFG